MKLRIHCTYIAFFVSSAVLIESSFNDSCSSRCDKQTLFANLIPKDYKKSQAPDLEAEMPTGVYVSLQIFDLHDLNEEKMDIMLGMYFNNMWRDNRLNMDCFKDMVKPIVVPLDVARNLWTADIIFENSRSEFLYKLTEENSVMKIMPGSAFYRYARYGIRISCPLDLHDYPMDIQACHFNITLFSQSDDVVQLYWADEIGNPVPDIKAVEMMSPVMLPQYQMLSVKTSRKRLTWDTGNFTTLTVTFTFSRHLSAYISNTYIPSLLVVILSWLSFWLDIDAVPARVTLGVTSLLTLATQIVQSKRSLPLIAYANALDVWNFVCVNLVFLTLVEYGLVYYNGYYRSNKNNAPKTIQRLMPKLIKSVASKKSPPTSPGWTDVQEVTSKGQLSQEATTPPDTTPYREPRQTSGARMPNLKTKTSQTLDKVSRILFPVFFLLFNIIYWSYYSCVSVTN